MKQHARHIAGKVFAFRAVGMLFLLAIVSGLAGIFGTSMLLSDAFERTPEGQSILQLNVEIAAALFAIAFGAAILIKEQERREAERQAELERKETERLAELAREEAELATRTDRKLRRIVDEVHRLKITHDELAAHIYAPVRYIWRRGAWISAVKHMEEHLTQPGFLYALETFYLAVDALRDADHDRALHIWNHSGRWPWSARLSKGTVQNMVTRHLVNFDYAYAALLPVLDQYGYGSTEAPVSSQIALVPIHPA